MQTVAVLGASGMLGSMVTDVLARNADFQVVATVRRPVLAQRGRRRLPMVDWRVLECDSADTATLDRAVGDVSWIINAIGLTKPYIHDDNPDEVKQAIGINTLFTLTLAQWASSREHHLLQIATDCVYSGFKGKYVESDPHDALDAYGKTKSLGESRLPYIHCLRCSIVGPEAKSFSFLLEWLRRQPQHAEVRGYTNHKWNGVTTLHFAKLCEAAVANRVTVPQLQHVIPTGTVSKADLLLCFAQAYQIQHVRITPKEAGTIVDRTLATANNNCNETLWAAAGYKRPPTIPDMVTELALFDYRMEGLLLEGDDDPRYAA